MKGKYVVLGIISLISPSLGYAASPTIERCFEFVPAPGQFVNTLPEWENGDDANSMARKVYELIAEEEGMVSLGACGGYVTFGFEKTIVNVEGERDFYIEGNAIQSDRVQLPGGSSEPGIVMVSFDINGNRLPDDLWFEIKGSEYDASVHGYEITYRRPTSDDMNIEWVDNQGNAGVVYKMPFHAQPHWPQWVNEEKLVFKGCRLPNNGENMGTSSNPYYFLKRFDFGYADNYPNLDENENRNEGSMIDIGWAVDENGNTVKMPGVDFIRICTGVNQSNGNLGESSTEVGQIYNLHTKISGGVEIVDEGVAIDQAVLNAFLDKYSEGASIGKSISSMPIISYANGMLSIDLFYPENVSVYDQTGRLHYCEEITQGKNHIDLSGYPKGIYIVKVGSAVRKILK